MNYSMDLLKEDFPAGYEMVKGQMDKKKLSAKVIHVNMLSSVAARVYILRDLYFIDIIESVIIQDGSEWTTMLTVTTKELNDVKKAISIKPMASDE